MNRSGSRRPADGPGADLGRPSLLRLTGVELRKLADTRAGYWLLITIGLISVAIMAVMLIFTPDADQQFANFFALAQVPVGILLPILGILLVTSEFSQRTTLTTFALVPQRHRVVLAKVSAGVVAGLISALVTLGTAAAGTLIASLGGTDDLWSAVPGPLLGAAVFQVVSVLMGIAFGLLFQNTPLAIVLSLVLPIAWSALGGMISGLRTAATWLDTGLTTAPLIEPPGAGELGAGQWARLGVSVTAWVLLPLVAGLVRTMRREVS
ncbi:ABC transporter permease [Plantactinospora sp. S1510]|uniref:ABC transporter permease n=1 Tax=Plantactinospora alkalitolerans TaxID=2789879 RepID=A0ABS0GP06_9ACTN|nr:ABC transporter permease [Plantactinospora alkalitolerans]MBF9127764.1 ABC transporter permease [Plantactinospora alkalitolerans]